MALYMRLDVDLPTLEPNTSLLLTKRSSGALSLAPMRMRNHETLVDITR
jgi:hypothetical protein